MILLLTQSLASNQISGLTPAQCARNAERAQAAFAGKIGSAIVHRINFPKVLAGKMGRTASLNARSRPLLSEWDSAEVRQTVALSLVATGAMERERMTFPDWKVAFRQARKVIGIDRNSKRGQSDTSSPIDCMTEAEADFLTATTRKPYHLARRKAIARKVRYMRTLIFTGFAIDRSRKRHATFKKQLAVSRFLASQYSERGHGFAEIIESSGDLADARYQTMKRFTTYLETAEAHLTAQALDGIKARKLEFKSFADLAAVMD